MEADERPTKIRKLENGSKARSEEPIFSINQKELANGVAEPPSTPKAKTNLIEADEDSDDEAASSQLLAELTQSAQQREEAEGAEEVEGAPVLSKNQQKKLKRKAEWEAGREDRKVKRREQAKARKERKRDEARALADERRQNGIPLPPKPVYQKPVQLPITFLVDCSFDELMNEKEMISLGSQLTRCYADNGRSKYRAHLTISGFSGRLKERFNGILAKHYQNWKGVRFFDEDINEVAEKAKEWMKGENGGKAAGPLAEHVRREETKSSNEAEEGEIIYLSSDSDVTLTHLKPYSTYIIGGLVDRNRHKGICHRKALDKGVKTARLPIGQYLEMQSRSVLATNHVNEIMLKWLECGDWGEAFMQVIPKRKGGTLKGSAQSLEKGLEQQAEDQVDEDESGLAQEPTEEAGKEAEGQDQGGPDRNGSKATNGRIEEITQTKEPYTSVDPPNDVHLEHKVLFGLQEAIGSPKTNLSAKTSSADGLTPTRKEIFRGLFGAENF